MNFKASESVIVHGFQAFYYELLRQKEKALSLYFSNTPSNDPDVESDNAENKDDKLQTEVEGTIVSVQKKLIDVIENVTDIIIAKSRIHPSLLGDVKYIMTVLADETFINLRWEGARFWRYYLLEKRLFQSEIAGDKFFTIVDEIISDTSDEELAFMCLISLSLGFKGRYRDSEESDDAITRYKDRLYSILHTKPSRLFYPGRSHLIESCYQNTHTDGGDSALPDTRFWSWTILGIVFVYIVISYCIWFNITNEIGDVLNNIEELIRNSPLI
jgi:type IV/VI secretion system ImpK/VasF family protein